MDWIHEHFGIVFWITVAIGCGVVELATVQLVAVWFVVGALMAAGAAYLGFGIAIQALVALSSSALMLVGLKKFILSKKSLSHELEFNVLMENKTGVVTKPITPLSAGQVIVDGDYWTAIALVDGDSIDVGTKVLIYRIDGAKCIVGVYEP